MEPKKLIPYFRASKNIFFDLPIKLIFFFFSDRSQKKLKKKDEALLAALKEAGVEGYEIPKSVGKPTLEKKEKSESNVPKSKKRTFAEAHPEEPEAKK